MHLLYLTDISQLNHLRIENPQLLTHMQPITGDIVVAFELERLKIEFIDEWDYLSPQDIEHNLETANKLSKNWWDESIASTEYEGFTLASTTGNDLLYFFEACLNAATVYKKLFQTYTIDRISGYFLPNIGVIRTGPNPAHRAVRSVVQAILFWFAENNGISVNRLESRLPLSEGKLVRKHVSSQQAVDDLLAKRIPTAEKLALIFYDGMPPSEYNTILKTINELPGWQVISISKRELAYGILFKNNSKVILGNSTSFMDAFREIINNYKGPHPEIFANPHLDFQFKRIWDEMEIAGRYGNVFSTFLDVLCPTLIIFGHEAFTIERVLVRLAKQRNIQTIGVVHEGLGNRVGFNGIIGDADSLMVWNNNGVEILNSYGVIESRLNKIGCIRYEPEFAEYNRPVSGNPEKAKSKKRKQRSDILADKPTILILTAAINTGFSVPIASPRKHREIIAELLKLITVRPDLQFIIKAHPGYDYYELYRKMVEFSPSNLLFIENISLGEVLEISDICLLINYFTTGALEAMLQRVPVIYLNNAVYDLPEWNDFLPGFKLNRISSVSELENSIDKLLNDSDYRTRTFCEANSIIFNILDVRDKTAKHRFGEFITNKITYSKADDQRRINVLSLSKKQFLNYLDVSLSENFLQELLTKHSIAQIIFTFSFIAGANNLGITTISRVYRSFQAHFMMEKISPWKNLRWPLYYAYLSGYNKNSYSTDWFSAFLLMKIVFPNLKKHKYSSDSTKVLIIKYLATSLLGNRIIKLKPLVLKAFSVKIL